MARVFVQRWQDSSTLTLLRVAPTHQDIATRSGPTLQHYLTSPLPPGTGGKRLSWRPGSGFPQAEA